MGQMAGYNNQSYYPGWMQSTAEVPAYLNPDQSKIAHQAADMLESCGPERYCSIGVPPPTTLLAAPPTGGKTFSELFAVLCLMSLSAAVGYLVGGVRSRKVQGKVLYLPIRGE